MCYLISFLRYLFEKIKLNKDTLLNNLQKANNRYTDSKLLFKIKYNNKFYLQWRKQSLETLFHRLLAPFLVNKVKQVGNKWVSACKFNLVRREKSFWTVLNQ